MADRTRPVAIILLTLAPATAGQAQTAETMMARARALTAPPACPADDRPDIVICGRADAVSRDRLPFPDERQPAPRPAAGGLVQAELFKAPGACGPTGSRRCTKREALGQGFGGGRNPLDQAARLADNLINGE